MRLGSHVRVERGYDDAVAYARKLGCSALQFFAGNPKTYRVGAIDAPALRRFAAARAAAGIAPAAIHTSYLINLASEDPKTVVNSLRLLKNDIAVAAAGDVAYVNTHLGSYGKRDRKDGFATVVAALEDALDGIDAERLAGDGEQRGRGPALRRDDGRAGRVRARDRPSQPARVPRHGAHRGRPATRSTRATASTGSSSSSTARWASTAS